jgi:hypothetical protein
MRFELSPWSFELSTKDHPMKPLLTALAAALLLLLPAPGQLSIG